MGIYPTTKIVDKRTDADGVETWEEQQIVIGVVHARTFTVTPWRVKERTDCFCCSCDPNGGTSDPACRNHGYYGQRPCEVHDMSGTPWGDTHKMPLSVQEVQRRRLTSRA